MTEHTPVYDEYIRWLVRKIYPDGSFPFEKLIRALNEAPFRWTIPRDKNRAVDGLGLRKTFAKEYGLDARVSEQYIYGPCSVLEMMVALAERCEYQIMEDDEKGNRTGLWFWSMVGNMGLGTQTDANFDENFVRDRIRIMIDRKYKPNGEGGLFYIEHPPKNLRGVEIWYQMCWYLRQLFDSAEE